MPRLRVDQADVGHPSAVAIVGADGDIEPRLHLVGMHGNERELAGELRIGQILARRVVAGLEYVWPSYSGG